MKEINITDIEGFQVGHAQDDTNATGDVYKRQQQLQLRMMKMSVQLMEMSFSSYAIEAIAPAV